MGANIASSCGGSDAFGFGDGGGCFCHNTFVPRTLSRKENADLATEGTDSFMAGAADDEDTPRGSRSAPTGAEAEATRPDVSRPDVSRGSPSGDTTESPWELAAEDAKPEITAVRDAAGSEGRTRRPSAASDNDGTRTFSMAGSVSTFGKTDSVLDSSSPASWRKSRKHGPRLPGTPDEERSYRRRPSRVSRMMSSRWAKPDAAVPAPPSQANRSVEPQGRRLPPSNANLPQDYTWLESTLETLARNKAPTLGCTDTQTGKGFVPVFFVVGACPNLFCGMQAVMYSVSGDGEVDFWWVKPSKSEGNGGSVGIEVNTLSRHAKGPHKNDPGRSKPFYKPLADLFHQGEVVEGVRFGIEKAGADMVSRAFLEQVSGGKDTRRYMHLVWQEDWTSNPFSRSKYIKGKIVYQKDPETLQFFSRQYSILNGAMTLSDREEQPFTSVLPGEDIKELWAD